MTGRTILIGISLMLTACVPLSREQTPPQPKPPAPANAWEGDDLPAVRTGTGTAALERLIPGGALEWGAPEAPVTMLIVTHPSCGYCRALHRQLLPLSVEPSVAQGLVRVHTMVLPLQKYPESALQAGMLLCAGKQGRGQAMLDWLMTQTVKDRAQTLRNKELPADAKALGACLDDPLTAEMLAVEAGLLDTLGVRLVPTIILNGEVHTGLPSAADLDGMIKESITHSRFLP